jgi:hypothetical protein
MSWDATAYAAHAETAVTSPATTWYFAEGATHSGFDLFYLIENPGAADAAVEVTYLLPAPRAPIVRSYAVAAHSRFNIWVNLEPGLAATDVSAVLRSSVPIIAERAMYLDAQGRKFKAGHESAGVTAPALDWFLAEGATGDYFDEFVLIANPGDLDAQVTATYLLPDGTTLTRSYPVSKNSRFNIWVDLEDRLLANTAVSTTIAATQPVIVERAMWWPGPTAATWHEAHNSPGATTTGTKWALADGEAGGTRNTQTYVLVANTSDQAASVQVTLLFEDGDTAQQAFTVGPHRRFNVDVGHLFPAASGRRFGTIVESVGPSPAPLVVERAMYWDANGGVWAAGTNALATLLR